MVVITLARVLIVVMIEHLRCMSLISVGIMWIKDIENSRHSGEEETDF